MKYFDKKNNRLVYVSKKANADFWDVQWSKLSETAKYGSNVPKINTCVIKTKKYLRRGARVLEGGCGLAQSSWYLSLEGYETVALDYAKETIDFLKKNANQVNPVYGDVRKTDFHDSYFDGYWSFGVIEHFWNGYDEILIEARRILKPDGYFFVTFPQMSYFRKFKAKLGRYKKIETDRKDEIAGFYQFALDQKTVIRALKKFGFEKVESFSIGGTKGIKDEISLGSSLLQKLYDSDLLVNKIIRKAIDLSASSMFGHTRVLIFRNKK